MHDYFRFKQFTIDQSQSAMKVGTDGVLLGAWADVCNASRILDIGTGTGLIALMAAQRNPRAQIDAVEIDEDAYKEAVDNINNSPWHDRIKVYHSSIFDFIPTQPYDCILCNPPFFIDSTPTPDQRRTAARHCSHFSHADLCLIASKLLSPSGKFNLILPVTEADRLLLQMQKEQFFVSRLTRVKPTPTQFPKRYLIEFCTILTQVSTEDMVIEVARHQYSAEHIRLTKDFYLKL